MYDKAICAYCYRKTDIKLYIGETPICFICDSIFRNEESIDESIKREYFRKADERKNATS